MITCKPSLDDFLDNMLSHEPDKIQIPIKIKHHLYPLHILKILILSMKFFFFVLDMSLIFHKRFKLTLSIDEIQIINKKSYY